MTQAEEKVSRLVLAAERKAELGGFNHRQEVPLPEDGLQRWATGLWDQYRSKSVRVELLERNLELALGLVEELMEAGLDRADERYYARKVDEVRRATDVPKSP